MQQRAQSLGARVHSDSPRASSTTAARATSVQASRAARRSSSRARTRTRPTISWLATLTAPLRADDTVAGVYGRQLPHDHATSARTLLPRLPLRAGVARPAPRAQASELSFEVTLFSNVNSAIPRRVWKQFPFADDIVMSEDQEWSRRVLRAGLTITYEAEAAVHHSHAYSRERRPAALLRLGRLGRALVCRRRASRRLRCGRRERGTRRASSRWLWTTGQRRWIPYTAVYELAKFAGLQLGRRHRSLPMAVKTRLSAYPEYWRE